MIDRKEIIKQIQMIKRANHIKKGGLIMSNIKITAKQISDEARKQKQEVLNRIARLGEFMQLNPNPEKTEYESPFQYLNLKEVSPERIKEQAKDSLSSYRQNAKSSIEQDYLNGLKQGENKKQKAEMEYEKNKSEIVGEYENLTQ